MTKLQILKETYDYYNEDVNRRAVNTIGLCEYFIKGGNGESNRYCAAGRCMVEEKIEKLTGSITSMSYKDSGIKVSKIETDGLFKKEYQGHSLDFWSDIQGFHDDDMYWTKTGISKLGEYEYKRLIKKYRNDTAET